MGQSQTLAVFGDGCDGAVLKFVNGALSTLCSLPNWSPVLSVATQDISKTALSKHHNVSHVL
jgi:hypothetical protein